MMLSGLVWERNFHCYHFNPDCAWRVLSDDNKHIGKMFKTNTVNIKNRIDHGLMKWLHKYRYLGLNGASLLT